MRVLHVISGLDPQNGGPTAAVAGLAAAQAAEGMGVTILATWKLQAGLGLAEGLRAEGVRVDHVGPARGALSRHPELAAVTRRCVAEADVVHVHALWEEVQHQAARAAARRGVPYFITPHGMLDPWSLAQSRLKKRLYLALRLRRNLDRAAGLHFITATERDQVAPLKLKPPPIVEPIGIDFAEFDPPPAPGEFREKHPEIGQRPYVVFLGRIHPLKGLELLVPAFARALELLPAVPEAGRFMLVVVGPDSQGFRARVEEDVVRHGLQQHVLFTGLLRGRDRVAALAGAELFSLPSYHENFGVSVVEALAAGTPVVISDQVFIHQEIAAAGLGGVTPTEAEPLARELARWLGDAALRLSAGARGPSFARDRYDWRSIARRWREHYRRAIQTVPAGRLDPPRGVHRT